MGTHGHGHVTYPAGFLVGARQTLLETFDGGVTWTPRNVDAAKDEGFNYRFNSIAFNGWVRSRSPSLFPNMHTSSDRSPEFLLA
jgi:photosystem II stability/assembly factor-like uncharacterized protein